MTERLPVFDGDIRKDRLALAIQELGTIAEDTLRTNGLSQGRRLNIQCGQGYLSEAAKHLSDNANKAYELLSCASGMIAEDGPALATYWWFPRLDVRIGPFVEQL